MPANLHPTMIAAAATATSLARALALLVLLTPIVLAAAHSAAGTRDRVLGATAGIAVAAGALVFAGVALSTFSGISTGAWIAALALIDVLLLVLWALRRRRPADAGAGGRAHRRRLPRPKPLPVLMSATALVLTGLAVAMSAASARRQEDRSHFTQLWTLATTRAGAPAAEIGVANFEGRATSYRIVVSSQGHALSPFLFSTFPLTVPASGTWQTTVVVPRTPERRLMSVTLYRGDDPAPYRETNLWTPAP